MAWSAPRQFTFTGKTPSDSVAAQFDAVTGAVSYEIDEATGNVYITTEPQGSGTAAYVQLTAENDAKFAQLTFVGWWGGVPSQAMELAAIRDSTSPQTKAFNWVSTASASVPTIKPRAGVDANMTGWESDLSLALATKYIFQVAVQFGTTATNGKTKVRLATLADPTTTIKAAEGTTFNTGTNFLNNLRIGKQAGSGTVDFNIDSVAAWDNAYEFLDPATDPAPPSSSMSGWAELIYTAAGWR